MDFTARLILAALVVVGAWALVIIPMAESFGDAITLQPRASLAAPD